MVGVPRGKRCEMCKERRRKCDGKLPSCSLCQRLKCPCVRPGKQFVFVGSRHDQPAGAERTVGESSRSRSSTEEDDESGQYLSVVSSRSNLALLSRTPSPVSTSTEQIAQRLGWILSDDENLSYGLTPTFGNYLEEIPKYIGQCPSLDAAVKVVLTGYTSFRTNNDNLNVVVAKEYSHALLQLRSDLSSFSGQGLPLVVAAVMMLALLETIDGSIKTGWMAHAGGASRLIKSANFNPWESELSKRILQSTRGTLMLEALMTEQAFDSNSQLWHDSVNMATDETPLQRETYRFLAMLPSLRNKAKKALTDLQSGVVPPDFNATFQEIQATAYNSRPVYEAMLDELETRMEKTATEAVEGSATAFNKDPEALRTLKFTFPAMVTEVLLHSWLSFYDQSSAQHVKEICQKICGYIPLGMQFRPLGSAHLTFALRIAYIGITSPIQREWIRDQIMTIHKDIQGPRAHHVTFKELDWWADTISLKCLSPTTMPWAHLSQDSLENSPPALKIWAENRANMPQSWWPQQYPEQFEDRWDDPQEGPSRSRQFEDFGELSKAFERHDLG